MHALMTECAKKQVHRHSCRLQHPAGADHAPTASTSQAVTTPAPSLAGPSLAAAAGVRQLRVPVRTTPSNLCSVLTSQF